MLDYILVPVLLYCCTAAIVVSTTFILQISQLPQAMALEVFPNLCVKHTGTKVEGQIYIGFLNYVIMLLTIAVVVGFKADSVKIGNAYGATTS